MINILQFVEDNIKSLKDELAQKTIIPSGYYEDGYDAGYDIGIKEGRLEAFQEVYGHLTACKDMK